MNKEEEKRIKQAETITEKMSEIKTFDRDLEKLDETKEFITISFNGEDGAENESGFSLGWNRDTNDKVRSGMARSLHLTARNLITSHIETLKLEVVKILEELK
ncbi:hypothetical protein LCGC14_1071650 [marine sediment metagenome]|uniref:DUF5082 domain-containing protein n=1 Tax=marine sediment metagenome TaxID=412755 RepID=A0A0F9MHY6_9ZZZZ